MSNPAPYDAVAWDISHRPRFVYEPTVPGWSEEREL
jgi:hypothetical protein